MKKSIKKGEMMKGGCCEPSDLVKIAGAIGGMLLVIIIMFLILAKELMAAVLPTIVWGFVVLGVVLGTLAARKGQKK
ncbi:hypothetical protein KY366_07720 [Candidatus Woesearchaeota archaeon]|nr:hypothetical protein [Candidatus Woesearchaeota archaeon]